MTRTGVVVVSYRPGPWLERCLHSVLEQADEVIVVDNGSQDNRVTGIAAALGARPVTLDRNAGFAGGANAGIAACRTDVVALLNDDAFAGPGWVKRSVAVLEDQSVAVVAPKILFDTRYLEIRLDETPHFDPPDPRPLGRHVVELTLGGIDVLAGALGPGIHRLETGPPGPSRWRWTTGSGPIYLPIGPEVCSKEVVCNGAPVEPGEIVDLINNAGSYLSAEGHGGDYAYGAPDRGAFDRPADRFAACGAAMAMRAESLQRVGPLAEHFFAYYEDTDWCWRAQLAGLRVRYEPASVVRHLGGATSGGPDRPFVRRLAARNRLATLARNAPLRVVAKQVGKFRREDSWPNLRLSLAKALSREALNRPMLRRRWALTPEEVWRRWAGEGERWPSAGRGGGPGPLS